MPIQITSLSRGFCVDFCEIGVGTIVAYAGCNVYFRGDLPKGYNLNRVVVDCLPVIVSLTKVRAVDVSYVKLRGVAKVKKVSKKQLGLF